MTKSKNSRVEIGNRIEELRTQKGVTQQEISKALFVDRVTISQWENGARDIKAGDIVSIADYFQVSTDYLLGRTNAKTTEPELRSVCDYTGLSEKAVKSITYKLKNRRGERREIEIFNKCVSLFITSKFFDNFVHSAGTLAQMKDEYVGEVLDSSYFMHVSKMESWAFLRDIYKEIVKEFKKTLNEPSFTEEKRETLSPEQNESEDSSHGDDSKTR